MVLYRKILEIRYAPDGIFEKEVYEVLESIDMEFITKKKLLIIYLM